MSYVVSALEFGRKAKLQELHELEIPTANLTALTANLNRDTKKQKKGYAVADFCFYAPKQNANEPEKAAANAFLHLADKGELPTWALFVFESMRHGDAARPPSPAAMIGDGVVILAPIPRNGGVEGLLLATHKASNATVMVTDGESHYKVAIPYFSGSRLAREGVYVPFM